MRSAATVVPTAPAVVTLAVVALAVVTVAVTAHAAAHPVVTLALTTLAVVTRALTSLALTTRAIAAPAVVTRAVTALAVTTLTVVTLTVTTLALAADADAQPTGSTEPPPGTDPPAPESGNPKYDAILDSLRTSDQSLFRWNEVADEVGWADGDSARWSPQVEGAVGRQTPIVGLGFHPEIIHHNKVDGVGAGGGIDLRFFRSPRLLVSGTAIRAFSRGAWMGETVAYFATDRMQAEYPWVLRAPITGGRPVYDPFDRDTRSFIALTGGWSERSVVFGTNRFYANPIKSGLLGIDGQSYLDRREVFGGVALRAAHALSAQMLYVSRKDRPLDVAHEPLFDTEPDIWANAPSERIRSDGVIAGFNYGDPRRNVGTLYSVRGSAMGSALGQGPEHYTLGFEVFHRRTAPGAEAVDLELWSAAVSGPDDIPVQSMADLGGASSLRAYPPRAQIGATAFLARADYISGVDIFRTLRIPLLGKLRLQPVIFADAGAVWGPARAPRDTNEHTVGPAIAGENGRSSDTGENRSSANGGQNGGRDDAAHPLRLPAWRTFSDLGLPSSGDWKFDWGVGLQRNLGFPGLLERARVDFAFRTDRATDRLRVTLRFIR